MRIFPLGDNAITVEFGNEVSLELNRKALALAKHLQSNPFEGYLESVPAYSSTTIFYHIAAVRKNFSEFESAFEAVSSVVEDTVRILPKTETEIGRLVQIPVIFNATVSLDLDRVADFSGVKPEDVISIYLERTYNVFMIGFLPGFAYLGEVDERIAIPRKQIPRLKVPRGSVAIGGKQTGVYPLESPGGWHVIGWTDMAMFDPKAEPTCPLQPGDHVQFFRV
ncbi:MAG: 5-oxoprolinase subunit PxpB [Pyrinomonadaceae bacterium]